MADAASPKKRGRPAKSKEAGEPKEVTVQIVLFFHSYIYYYI